MFKLKYVDIIIYEAQSMKRAFMQFAGNADQDQRAYSRWLVKSFVRSQNQWILKYMSTNRDCLDQTTRMHMLIWTLAVRL